MLEILLKILIITGWILLALFSLVLVLFVLVLLYPVSYRISWEKNMDIEHTFRLKASWLFGIVRIHFQHPSPGSLTATVFGIKVFSSHKKKSKTNNIAQKRHKITNTTKKPNHDSGEQTTEKINKEHVNTDHSSFDTKDCISASEKGTGPINKMKNIFIRLKEKISAFLENIKKLASKAGYYKELLQEEDTANLFSHVFLRSGKIVRSLRPRKIEGHILFGTGSPDTTGYLMWVYGILSPYLGQNLTVTPDFDTKILDGKLMAKGRIMIVILLVNGLKVGLDKKLHTFMKKLKMEER